MRGYYSYGIGQLPEAASALLEARSAPTRPVLTTAPVASPVIDAAVLRSIQAAVAKRTTQAGVPLTTGFTLLAPKPATAATQQAPWKMAASQVSELTTPKVGVRVSLPGAPPSNGAAAPNGAAAAAFDTACKEAGGSVISPLNCQLADGAVVTVDAQGNAVCVNTAGRCAAEPAVKGGGGALLLGAAALAALMLLR